MGIPNGAAIDDISYLGHLDSTGIIKLSDVFSASLFRFFANVSKKGDGGHILRKSLGLYGIQGAENRFLNFRRGVVIFIFLCSSKVCLFFIMFIGVLGILFSFPACCANYM